MEDKKKMLLADMALLLAAACWGGGFVAGDIAVENFSPFFIMAVRFTGAALFMGLLFRRHVKSSTKEDWKAGMILGSLLFVAQPFQIIALKYTTPSKQAFLLATYVILVPFISWLVLRKRPGIKAFVAGVLALVGIGLISLNGSLGIELGDGLTLLFSLLYSFLIVATGILAKRVNPLAMSFFQYLTTGVLSIGTTLLFEERATVFPAAGVGALVYLMTINTVVAYTLQNVAQRYTSDTHSAVLISTESVIGYFCGVVLYGDPFTPKVLMGGLIVFSAVLLSVVEWGKVLHLQKEKA
ncbi:MAG: DMT family transporter [Bacteroidales bacterium]|nr:DMT family transporter [Anaerotignum sp.]MCI5679827.1 DMT family transporter [Bacteroidales bacterium]MDY3925815.1 DMT family transporter [Anaerotignum sp.]